MFDPYLKLPLQSFVCYSASRENKQTKPKFIGKGKGKRKVTYLV